MSADKIIKINNEHEVEYLREKTDILEQVISFSVAEQIKRDKEEIERLKTERDTFKGQAETIDKRVEEVKKAYEEAKKNFQKTITAEKDKQLSDFKKNTNSKKIKPLEEKLKELEQAEKDKIMAEKRVVEVETLLKSRDEEIERLTSIENKIDTMTELLINNFNDIKDMLINNESKESIIETIEEIEDNIKNKNIRSKAELEAEDREIVKMMNDGLTDTEIADIIYKHLDDVKVRRVQLSKRKQSKRFKSIAEKELVGN